MDINDLITSLLVFLVVLIPLAALAYLAGECSGKKQARRTILDLQIGARNDSMSNRLLRAQLEATQSREQSLTHQVIDLKKKLCGHFPEEH
jgi:hypothetical protein